MKHTIVVIGPPGSGKGTQAELLSHALGAVHLSSGQVLREHASAAVQAEMKRGELVRETEVDVILETSLQEANPGSIWILDGYIRLAQDRDWLEASLKKLGRKIDLVIIFEASETTCRERVLGRGRTDDTVAAWGERWNEFVGTTIPVINSLTNLPYLRIDASGAPKT
ncbi:MAG: nucleoside monophosphate kinase, partial [Candidatus Saccharibacteria bacterium]